MIGMATPRGFQPVTVDQAITEYRDTLHLRVAMGALSATTRDAYLRDLAEARGLFGAGRVLDEIEPDDVELAVVRIANAPDRRYTRRRKVGPGGAPVAGRGLQARARWLAAVRGLFAWAAERGYVRADPMPQVSRVRVPPRATGGRLGLSVEAALALREVPRQRAATGRLRADQRLTLRDEAVLRLLTETGPRVAEICAADVDDIRRDEAAGGHVLRIRAGKGGKARHVPLSDGLVDVLTRYQTTERPLAAGPDAPSRADAARSLLVTIRGRRLSPRDVQRMVERHVRHMPAEHRQAVTPHGLRHTAATVLLRHAGADIGTVADILGHADVGTTSVYLDPSATAAAQALGRSPLAG
jgi:integrase/recombinase XerD